MCEVCDLLKGVESLLEKSLNGNQQLHTITLRVAGKSPADVAQAMHIVAEMFEQQSWRFENRATMGVTSNCVTDFNYERVTLSERIEQLYETQKRKHASRNN